jgi:signal transduction histidine kinase
MGIRERVWPGLRPRSIAFEAVIALIGTVAVGITTGSPDDRLTSVPVVLVGTLILGITLFLFRRSAPLVPFLVGAVLAVASPAVTIAVPLTAYAIGRYEGRWPVRIGAAVVGFLAVAQPWTLDELDQWIGAVGGAALVVGLAGALGAWARTRVELLAALTERAEKAESERELMARDAVLTERTRIAREMHDAVGHRVSLMVLQAGAIEMAATDPGRVQELAGQVQTAGRQALDELRQMVGVLRGGEVDDAAPLGPQPGLDDLPRLIEQSRAAGMTVDLRGLPADAGPIDPAVGRAAYRIVQEALTNGGKHAPGADVCVEVERLADQLLVRIVNGPAHGTPVTSTGGGYGLVGLGERVRTLGGRLRTEPRLDGGFLVEAVLPT